VHPMTMLPEKSPPGYRHRCPPGASLGDDLRERLRWARW
jgi:hypothetical protein